MSAVIDTLRRGLRQRTSPLAKPSLTRLHKKAVRGREFRRLDSGRHMPPQSSALVNVSDRMKSFLSLGRELLLIGIVVICLVRPASIPQWLCTAGFKEVKAFDVSVAPECIAKQEVRSELSQENVDLAKKPVEQQIAQPVSPQVVAAVAQAQEFAPDAVPTSGWIFLGKTDAAQTRWADGQPQTIESVNLPIKAGTQITIRDDVYLRADVPATNYKSTGKVVSVLRVGQKVDVKKIEPTSAKGGGFFLWASVFESRV